jgi:hypothetical protein
MVTLSFPAVLSAIYMYTSSGKPVLSSCGGQLLPRREPNNLNL